MARADPGASANGGAALLGDLRALVEIESPSGDAAGIAEAARLLGGWLEARVGGAAEVGDDGRLTWRHPGQPGRPGDGAARAEAEQVAPVLLLGHLDTVWPRGTLERLPFAVADGRVTGPGGFDMKAGLVVALHACQRLAQAGALPAVELLATADEEVGGGDSRAQILDAARRCGRVLVLEPSGPGGAVKTARKGMALGRLAVHGRAAHSGLEPERGVNAATALGSLLELVERIGDPARGTTVVPTLVRGGRTMNTVPDLAEAHLDIRVARDDEADRVRADLQTLPAPPDTRLEVSVELDRPPLTEAASAPLRGALEAAADAVGWTVETMAVGGVSDGNVAAGAGAAVLDGLGPAGGGAHAEDEHVLADDLPVRVDLLAALLPRAAAIAPPGR